LVGVLKPTRMDTIHPNRSEVPRSELAAREIAALAAEIERIAR